MADSLGHVSLRMVGRQDEASVRAEAVDEVPGFAWTFTDLDVVEPHC